MKKLMTLTAAGFCLYMGTQNALAARTAVAAAATTNAAVPAVDAVDQVADVADVASEKNTTDWLLLYAYNIYEMEKAIDGVQKMKMDYDDAFCGSGNIVLIPAYADELNSRMMSFNDEFKMKMASMYDKLGEYKQMVEYVRNNSNFEEYEFAMTEKVNSLHDLVEDAKNYMHGFWANWLQNHEHNNFAHYNLEYIKALDLRREVYDWKNTLTYLSLQPNRGIALTDWASFISEKRAGCEEMDRTIENLLNAVHGSLDNYEMETLSQNMENFADVLQENRRWSMNEIEELLQEREQPVDFGPSEWAACEGAAAIVAVEQRINEAHLRFEKFKETPYVVDSTERQELIESFDNHESMLRAQLEGYYSELQNLVNRDLIHNGLSRFKEELASIDFDYLDADLNHAADLLTIAMTNEASYNRMVQIERDFQLDSQAVIETMEMMSVLFDDEVLSEEDRHQYEVVWKAAMEKLTPRYDELQNHRQEGRLTAEDVTDFEYATDERIRTLYDAAEAFQSLALKSLQETDETSPRFRYVMQQMECANLHNQVLAQVGKVRLMATYQPIWISVDNYYEQHLNGLEAYCMEAAANCVALAKDMSEAYRAGEYENGADDYFESVMTNLLDGMMTAEIETFRDQYEFDAPDYSVYGTNDVALQHAFGEKLRLDQRLESLIYTVAVTPAMLGDDPDSDEYEDVNDAVLSVTSILVDVESRYDMCLAAIQDAYKEEYGCDVASYIDYLNTEIADAQVTCSSLRAMLYDFFKARFDQQGSALTPLYTAYRDTNLALLDVELALQLEEYDILGWRAVLAALGESEDMEAVMTKQLGLLAATHRQLDDLRERANAAYSEGDAESSEWASIKADAADLSMQHRDDAANYRSIWQNLINYNASDGCIADAHILAADIYHNALYVAQIAQRVADVRALVEGQKSTSNEGTAFEDIDVEILDASEMLMRSWEIVKILHDNPTQSFDGLSLQTVVTQLAQATAQLTAVFNECYSNYMAEATAAIDPESAAGRYAEFLCAVNAHKTHIAAMNELGNIFVNLLEHNVNESEAIDLLNWVVNSGDEFKNVIEGYVEQIDYYYNETSPEEFYNAIGQAFTEHLPDFTNTIAYECESLLIAWTDMQTPFSFLTDQTVVGNYREGANPSTVELPVNLAGSEFFDKVSFSVTLPLGQTADDWTDVVTLAPALVDAQLTVTPATDGKSALVTITPSVGQFVYPGVMATVKVSVTSKGDEYVVVDDVVLGGSTFLICPHGMTLLTVRGVVLDEHDITGDSTFDAADVETMGNLVAADPTTMTDMQKAKADLNGDGEVTIGDITTAIRLLNEKQ